MDYPYAIGAMPAWPVKAFCGMLVDAALEAGSRHPRRTNPNPDANPDTDWRQGIGHLLSVTGA